MEGEEEVAKSPSIVEEAIQKARKFSFVISSKRWSSLAISTDRRGERRFAKGWTDVFYKKVRQENLTCPLLFKKNYIRKEGSRKKHIDFFHAEAHCKFDGCVKYKFRIKKEPKSGDEVKVKVSPIKPHNKINHQSGILKARFVAGKYRKKVAEEIRKEGPSNTFYNLLGSTEEESLQAGNTSGFGSKQVIQKISSEINLTNRLHKDVIIEVALLKTVYEKEDDTEGPVRGWVQSLSFYPFSVMVYSAEQISVLHNEMSKHNAVLYFDATGTVIAKIPGQSKRVLYYALLLKGKEAGDPPLPVAEFISNSHTTVDISNFLMTFLRDVQQRGSRSNFPARVEVDYSWAMIHAVLLSFNRENISVYLKRAWDHIHGKVVWESQTKVHICSAHLMHKMACRLSAMTKEKTTKRFIMFVIARMVDCNNFQEIENIFSNLSILLLSENVSSHKQYRKANAALENVIQNSDEVAEEGSFESFEKEGDVHGMTPSTSVFARHFSHIAETTNSSMEPSSSSRVETNPYHCPEAIRYLVTTYMSILPFWSGLLLDVHHDTNSPAENWMKILKKDILRGKTRMSPTNFIIESRCSLKGRLREFGGITTKGDNVSFAQRRTKNNKRTVVLDGCLSSEESWRAKKKKKKAMYLRQPHSSPVDSTGLKHALHWGGTMILNGKTISVTNTCPVDNMLVLLHHALKKQFISDWFESYVDRLEVCKVLLEIHRLFLKKQWSDGRALWLQQYCQQSNADNWDIYGSEWKQFVQHYGPVQETESISSCSKRRCPQKSRKLSSREIMLGDRTSGTTITLQESIKLWEEPITSVCLAGGARGRCQGERQTTRRRFLHPKPPVLILNVAFLSEAREFTPSKLPTAVEVSCSRYSVFACTIGDGSHFRSFFTQEGKWYKYDGLTKPEITGSLYPPPGAGQLRLYSMRFCPYAQRTRLVLAHKTVPYETININLKNKPDWFKIKSPAGTIPVLEKDGQVVYDSVICCQFLDEMYTSNRLNPTDPCRRAQDRMLMDRCGKLFPAYYKFLISQGKDEDLENTYLTNIDIAEEELIKRGSCFGGDSVSMVDFLMWPFFERWVLLEKVCDFKPSSVRFPGLHNWIARMYEEPAVKSTMVSEKMHVGYGQSLLSGAPDYDYGL